MRPDAPLMSPVVRPRLGAFNAATAYIYGACTIVEAAVYGRALTDAEVSSIEADLKARHGL